MEIYSNIKIDTLEDLRNFAHVLKETNVKVNKSQLARELKADRRTVGRILEGFEKSTTRNKKSKLDYLDEKVAELLASETQRFYYVSVLYRYLQDNENLQCSESTFRYYINRNEEFKNYFDKGIKVSNALIPVLMHETPPGEQAQIDWKESQSFVLNTGEVVVINIFVYILSYSRFRIYFLSIEKERPILLDFLTRCFEITGGVPKVLVTDNMKTVMDQARTEHFNGVVNDEFENFAKQMGFKTHPCIAGSPNTKSKVESPMKILDELHAYSGKLSFEGLVEKLNVINNRENIRYHKEYGRIPADSFNKEKDFLLPLPNEKIRSQFKLVRHKVKVSSRCTIKVNNSNYSVPPKFFGKEVEYVVFNSNIYIYYNENLIKTHSVSEQLMNYDFEDYVEILSLQKLFRNLGRDDIEAIAKNNLEEIAKLHGK